MKIYANKIEVLWRLAMCPYMIYYQGELPVCEPKKELCTMCVIGNKKTFEEIQKENNKSK